MVYFYIRDCYIKLDDEDKVIEYEDYGIMLDKYSEYIGLYEFSCQSYKKYFRDYKF